MSNFIDNIPNTNNIKNTNNFENIKDESNYLIEGFEIIDNNDLEYSQFNKKNNLYMNKKHLKSYDFKPSSLNEKINAIVKKEINIHKPQQYNFLADDHGESYKVYSLNFNKNHKYNNEDDDANKKIKTNLLVHLYVGSLTVVGLFLLYRFIQKSR